MISIFIGKLQKSICTNIFGRGLLGREKSKFTVQIGKNLKISVKKLNFQKSTKPAKDQ